LPADIFVRDEVLLQNANGKLRAMLDTLQGTVRRDRFSRERICNMVTMDDPGYEFLLSLADGMEVAIPEGFKVRSEPIPLRQLYKESHPAINELLAKQWVPEKAIILRTSVARSIPGIHYSPDHWCTSKDKQEGRQLYGFLEDTGGSAVSRDEVREWGRVNIGLIHNPTFSELINMIMRFFDEEVVKHRLSLSRTFQSFIKGLVASYLLVYDASLSGFGGQVFDLRSGEPVLVGVLRGTVPQ
jgi:hypothetical protein